MPYQFTIEQLAERGYYAFCGREAWFWGHDGSLISPCFSKEEAIAAASQHCRENYEPPRPDGVPQNAEFRLAKEHDTFHPCVDLAKIWKCICDWRVDESDKFNGRRWCWREDEEKPKAAIDETVEVSEITKEVLQETLSAMGKHKPMPTRHDAYGVIKEELDEFWDEVRERKPDPAKMRRELIQVASMAVRAIHDAKGWEE